MKSVGEILSEERKKQHKNLDELSFNTKIPVSSLEKLENDRFDLLPPEAFVKGFIRNYAQELLLDPEKVLAVFRRDHQVKSKNKLLPKGMAHPLDESSAWTDKISRLLFPIIIITVIVGFLFFQVKSYIFAPKLSVLSPKDNEVIHSLTLEVKGVTIPDAAIYVNNQLASVNFDGNFDYSLSLLPGENIIKIKSVSRTGKETEVKRTVTVDKER